MKNEIEINETSYDEICRFIIKFGENIHGYGPNAYRLEMYLNQLVSIFGIQGVFHSTPSEIVFAFSQNKIQWQRMHISAMNGTGVDLNRMAKVGDLINDLENGKLSIAEANICLDEINKQPHPWGNSSMALAYVMCGVSFPVLMGGSWFDLILSGIFSFVVFLMVMNSSSRGLLAAVWLPVSTAFVAGVLTGISRYYFTDINMVLIVLSSVLILVPGYGVSVGVVEIVSNHLNSGLSNLVTNVIYLFKQVFGGWFGIWLVGRVLPYTEASTAEAINSHWLWLFMPILIIGLGIALQTPYRDFFWACLAMVISYVGILLGSDIVGVNFGNFLGAILLVFFTNTWARNTKRPPSIVLVPAFILLVSGSIGFRGLAAMAGGDAVIGGQQFMQMFIVALTLAIGLFIGNSLIKPNKQV